MEKQFTELRELLLSIDSNHFTWNDARADVLNQLHDLQSKAENLPISPVVESCPKCKASDIEEVDDNWTGCNDCGHTWVG